MKVFQDFISKLDSTEKRKSSFGYLCMKKRGSFPKERFSFLLKSSMGGGFDPRNTPREYATAKFAKYRFFFSQRRPIRFKCKKCPILKLNRDATSQYLLNLATANIAFFIADEGCYVSLLWQVQQVSLNTSEPDLFHCILQQCSSTFFSMVCLIKFLKKFVYLSNINVNMNMKICVK